MSIINLVDNDGKNALIYAAEQNNKIFISLLSIINESLLSVTNGSSEQDKNSSANKKLMNSNYSGINFNIQDEKKGKTVLMELSKNGNYEGIKKLFSLYKLLKDISNKDLSLSFIEMDLNIRNKNGHSALGYAMIHKSSLSIFKLLLEKGTTIKYEDTDFLIKCFKKDEDYNEFLETPELIESYKRCIVDEFSVMIEKLKVKASTKNFSYLTTAQLEYPFTGGLKPLPIQELLWLHQIHKDFLMVSKELNEEISSFSDQISAILDRNPYLNNLYKEISKEVLPGLEKKFNVIFKSVKINWQKKFIDYANKYMSMLKNRELYLFNHHLLLEEIFDFYKDNAELEKTYNKKRKELKKLVSEHPILRDKIISIEKTKSKNLLVKLAYTLESIEKFQDKLKQNYDQLEDENEILMVPQDHMVITQNPSSVAALLNVCKTLPNQLSDNKYGYYNLILSIGIFKNCMLI